MNEMLLRFTVYICLTHAKNKVYYNLLTYYLPNKQKTVEKKQQSYKKYCLFKFSPSQVIFNSLSKKAEVQLQVLAENVFLMTKPSTEQLR